MKGKSVYSESSKLAFYKSIFVSCLRPATLKCVPSIFRNFFLWQYRCAFLPGRVPVSNVDHPLDERIPFTPSWSVIYLDFIHYWIRMLSFLLCRYRRRSYPYVRDFIKSIGDLYAFAAQVYRKHLSTTKRPFYISRPRFFVIHLFDPHLMCIPSLHVMVVIHTFKQFALITKELGDEDTMKEQIFEMKQGALAICQAILFIKQHSINCIAAALYAMTRFNPQIFPPSEAEAFTALLFSPAPDASAHVRRRSHPSFAPSTRLPDADVAEINNHILSLYRRFLVEGERSQFWGEPLINFLREQD